MELKNPFNSKTHRINMVKNFELKNPWMPQDEGDHHPVMKEWWTIETFFKTLDNSKKWNLMNSFAYEMETPSCFFQYVLFDLISKKCILHEDINDDFGKLFHKKNKVDLKFEKSTISGVYPNYKIHIEDQKQGLIIDMLFKAKSLPHWVAQDITNGNLPIGLNFYKYGFLPHCDIFGTFTLRDESYKINSKGYLEHAWGNWTYRNPIQKLSNLKTTISSYTHLSRWWFSHHQLHIPQSITLTTENNPFGYDWIWGIFDNNWSLFYGNSLFWISKGPVFGMLCITPDGKNYWEFCNLKFRYNKLNYIEKYDIYYPFEIELNGVVENKEIHLRFWSTTDSYEYISPFNNNEFYKAWILCEMPGRMEGTYKDGNKIIKLKGDCKIVPLRQPSYLGHNSLTLNFLKPPLGVGVNIKLVSHYLNKQVITKLHLAPRPLLRWKVKKINKKEF